MALLGGVFLHHAGLGYDDDWSAVVVGGGGGVHGGERGRGCGPPRRGCGRGHTAARHTAVYLSLYSTIAWMYNVHI